MNKEGGFVGRLVKQLTIIDIFGRVSMKQDEKARTGFVSDVAAIFIHMKSCDQ